jgi:hypothetical protein
MADREVGRFNCEKCGRPVVCAGTRTASFKGVGAYTGPCPWECGGWMNRGFRSIKPGQVRAFRADEWDARPTSALTG